MKRFFLIITIFLISCSSGPKSLPESTAGITPTQIAPSMVPSATSTQIPAPTATSTLAYPVKAGTAFPAPSEQITTENISLLKPISAWKSANIIDVQYSKDGKYLAVTLDQGQGVYYDTSNYKLTAGLDNVPLDNSPVYDLSKIPDGDFKAISIDGKYGATITNSTINIYEMPNLTPIKTNISKHEYKALSFSPTGSILATTDSGVYYWNFLEENSSPKYLQGNDSQAFAFSNDGTKLLIGTRWGALYFHNLTSIGPNGVPAYFALAYNNNDLRKIISSPDSKIFATLGRDNIIKIWDAENADLIYTIDDFLGPLGWYGKIIFSNNKDLFVGYSDSTIKLWNTQSGTIIDQFQDTNFYKTFHGPTTIEVYSGTSPMYDYSISKDGALISIAGHSAAGVWDTNTHKQIFSFEIQSTNKNESISPDGRYIAVTDGGRGNLYMFDLTTGTQIWKAGGMYAELSFSPDGSLIAATSLNELKPVVFFV